MSLKLLQAFESPYLGHLKNRVVMAAMTRGFADPHHGATSDMRDYYVRRAEDGVALILTEGVIIHPSADGYNKVPHIATQAQAETWKPVVEGVQAAGSKIFCQLWHCGRISHEDYTGGVPPVSSTDQAAEGINRQNGKPFAKPTRLTVEGIAEVHAQYLQACENALAVGFDGVQLHFGHGYLADQFFDARINDRADQYGGSIENRCRFVLELTEKVLARFDTRKIAVRISPSRDMGSIYDWPDMERMVPYLLENFWRQGLRNLDISCARADYYQTSGRVIRMARPLWPGLLMGGASLTVAQAEDELANGNLDMITWGRALLANPDFVHRVREHQPLREFAPSMLGQLL